MNIVAVSQRVDAWQGRNEIRDALDQALVRFLAQAGMLVVPVPNSLVLLKRHGHDNSLLQSWLENVKPNAILLSGGNDIGSIPERDATEKALLDFALQKNLAVLGICRGMQMLAVYEGVKLADIRYHIATRHQLTGEINHAVNSYHGQCIIDCPQEYRVLARSEDGNIEAIQHKKRAWQGWMWHPEREEPFVEQDIKLLKQLLMNEADLHGNII